MNFIEDVPDFFNFVDMIIMNPPFSLKKQFYQKCLEYKKPFALLIPCDYSQWTIAAVDKQGCEKIVPYRRINYITPFTINRVNDGEGTNYTDLYEIPEELLYRYSSCEFHSMWLTNGLNIGQSEIFVPLETEYMRKNILAK